MNKKIFFALLIFILAIGTVIAADNIRIDDVSTDIEKTSSEFVYTAVFDLYGVSNDDCKVVAYFYEGDTLVKNTTQDLAVADKCEISLNCTLDAEKDIDHIEIVVFDNNSVIFNQTETFNSTADEPQQESSATYVASSNSDKFHTPNCQWAKKISGSNKITFSSRDAAVNSGYTPCSVCHP
ncbi:MAG: hypothetical protein Q4P18_08345 [Methanobrevibacter sp.]|uniref:hypothetical protein n=1 Tax=Methanobrevibacter sp. TaxID=66852 RepID=UPI0026DEA3EF|nr:hypothetical protein [Methanobrevibacter sp.]MDO5849532.1 hypothetical protein [Methanobrevibacter sp.]